MISQVIKLTNPTGLHMRPAGNLCREAVKYKCKVTFAYGAYIANAKSVLSVLGAGVKLGDEITLICDGIDETEALNHLVPFIENSLEG